MARRRADDIDDAAAPLPLHVRQRLPRHADIPEELETPAPQPFLVRRGEEVPPLDGTRIVDEDVDPAEPAQRLCNERAHTVERGEVHRYRFHAPARLRLDLARRAGEDRLLARGDEHARALGGQAPRRRAPYPLAPARHHRRLVLESQIHGCLS
jgi:hypothetical protein